QYGPETLSALVEVRCGADRPDLLRVQADGPPGDRRRVAQRLVVQVHPVGPVMGAQVKPLQRLRGTGWQEPQISFRLRIRTSNFPTGRRDMRIRRWVTPAPPILVFLRRGRSAPPT